MKIKLIEGKKDYKFWRKWAIIFFLFFIVGGIFMATGNKNPLEPSESSYNFCSKIEGTPAWSKDGEIIGYGYREDWSVLPDGVFFYYNPRCYPCQKQIENFGEQYFSELKEGGYAIDCTK